MSAAPRVAGHLVGASPRNGLPEGGGYVYRGRNHDVDEETTTSRRDAITAALARKKNGEIPDHGTAARYAMHRRQHEEPCTDCRAANAAETRERRAKRKAAAA